MSLGASRDDPVRLWNTSGLIPLSREKWPNKTGDTNLGREKKSNLWYSMLVAGKRSPLT